MKLMGDFLSSSIVLLLLRFVLSSIFTIAGLLKLVDLQAFADNISTFQVLPAFLINIFALTLPFVEVIVGVLLAFGWNKSTVTLGMVFLSTMFAFALLQGMIRGLSIDCGCFGEETPSRFSNWFALTRDMFLIAGSLVLYYQFARPPQVNSASEENIR